MNIKERVKDELVSRGMFDNQAEEVLKLAENEINEMKGRWGDSIKDYPNEVLAALLLRVFSCALDWIDNNFPKAWYRPMFE